MLTINTPQTVLFDVLLYMFCQRLFKNKSVHLFIRKYDNYVRKLDENSLPEYIQLM